MKKLLVPFCLTLIIFIGSVGVSWSDGFEKGHRFTDTDWNLAFDNYAGFPVPDGEYQSVKWVKEGKNKFLRFELRNGDKGVQYNDQHKRSWDRSGAPWWERAEVRAKNVLEADKKYSFEFEVRFVKGFNGDRENFFQIKNETGACTPAPLMFRASQGFLKITTQDSINAWGPRIWRLAGQVVLGRWTKYKLVFDTSEISEASLYVNGKLQIEAQPFPPIGDCGGTHLKFGIYRGGNGGRWGGNETSIVDFDKINLNVIE